MATISIPQAEWERSNALARTLYRFAVRDGGATLSPVTGTPYAPDRGYFVGIHPGTFATAKVGYRFATETLATGIRRIDREYPLSLYGVWLSGDTIHLDPVQHVLDLGEALDLGAERNQQAVWDIAAGKEIQVR